MTLMQNLGFKAFVLVYNSLSFILKFSYSLSKLHFAFSAKIILNLSHPILIN